MANSEILTESKHIVLNVANKDGEGFIIESNNLKTYAESWIYFTGSKKECLNFIKNN